MVQVSGLEDALEGLVTCNHDYRDSVRRESGSTQVALHEELREEMDCVYDDLSFKRSEETAILEENRTAQLSRKDLEQKVSDLTASVDICLQQLVKTTLPLTFLLS